MAPKRKRTGSALEKAADAPETSPPHTRSAQRPTAAAVDAVDDAPSKRAKSNGRAEDAEYSIATGGKVSMPANGTAAGDGENGEAGTMRMAPPPKAGTVEPVGYHTNPPPTGRAVRVYADGVFDLFHLGHMRVLQQAKSAFPDTYLIVGVTGDAETHRRKGLTVMSGKERAESLRHCRWVDEVVEDCPWIINVEFLERHRIDYVAHDDIPYGANEGDDIYKPIKERGMFLVTQRTEGVSTTGIITKIVRDYDQYVSRQLQRGTSRRELNISWLKKNEIDIRRHVTDLRDTIRQNWTTTGQELSKDFRQLWLPSRPPSPAPSVTAPSRSDSRAAGARSPLSPTADAAPAAQQSRSGRAGHSSDFATGYAMGLIGGVRGWMEGSRSRRDGHSHSPDHSPARETPAENVA